MWMGLIYISHTLQTNIKDAKEFKLSTGHYFEKQSLSLYFLNKEI